MGASRAMPSPGVPIAICADDYAMTSGISEAIRCLAAGGRLSAVSCVVTSPHWPEEARRLQPLAVNLDVGLHFALTYGRSVASLPRLAPTETLPSPPRLMWQAFAGRLDRDEVAEELGAQLDRFVAAFGRLPDFVDSHHHCHLLPGVREAVVDVFHARLAGRGAWLRYLTMSPADVAAHYRLALPGAVSLTLLGRGLTRLGARCGIRGNTAFRGIRRFFGDPPYQRLFSRFVEGLRPGGLIMCHPGLDDGERLPTQHPIAAREEEFAFLRSDAALATLDRHGVSLTRLAMPSPSPLDAPLRGVPSPPVAAE